MRSLAELTDKSMLDAITDEVGLSLRALRVRCLSDLTSKRVCDQLGPTVATQVEDIIARYDACAGESVITLVRFLKASMVMADATWDEVLHTVQPDVKGDLQKLRAVFIHLQMGKK